MSELEERIVSRLNEDFYERTGNEEFYPATIESVGSDYSVLFLGFPVYQSCNDSLDEDTNQTLEEFVMVGVNDLIDDICKLKGVER
jgi:hypothetical protein